MHHGNTFRRSSITFYLFPLNIKHAASFYIYCNPIFIFFLTNGTLRQLARNVTKWSTLEIRVFLERRKPEESLSITTLKLEAYLKARAQIQTRSVDADQIHAFLLSLVEQIVGFQCEFHFFVIMLLFLVTQWPDKSQNKFW